MHRIGCTYKISSKNVYMETMEEGQDKMYLSSEKWSKNYFKKGPLLFTV